MADDILPEELSSKVAEENGRPATLTDSGKRKGRPPGSRDKKPRSRRTKEELPAPIADNVPEEILADILTQNMEISSSPAAEIVESPVELAIDDLTPREITVPMSKPVEELPKPKATAKPKTEAAPPQTSPRFNWMMRQR